MGEKVSPEARARVELVLTELKEAVATNDTRKIRDGIDGIQSALRETGASFYKSEKEPSQTSSLQEEDVSDEEFVETQT